MPGELVGGAEVLRVLAQAVQQPLGQRLGRDPVAAGEVDQLALEPVARGQPLVLVEHLPRVVGELLARLEVLGELLDHRLDQGGQADRVLDARLGVAGADLDGAQVRVGADVVPEVGVVLDHAAGAP